MGKIGKKIIIWAAVIGLVVGGVNAFLNWYYYDNNRGYMPVQVPSSQKAQIVVVKDFKITTEADAEYSSSWLFFEKDQRVIILSATRKYLKGFGVTDGGSHLLLSEKMSLFRFDAIRGIYEIEGEIRLYLGLDWQTVILTGLAVWAIVFVACAAIIFGVSYLVKWIKGVRTKKQAVVQTV